MAKTCNHEGCKYNQFGGGFCKAHQYKRTDKNKKLTKFIVVGKRFNGNVASKKNYKKRIKAVSKKQAVKIREKKQLSEKDKQFWAAIWEEREHVDFETGEPIHGEPLTIYFHHVLPKHKGPGGYPQFRYKKWNIVIVSWQTHTNAENNIDLVPKIKAYRDKLLKTKIR